MLNTSTLFERPALGLGCLVELTMTRGQKSETFHYLIDELTTDFGRGFRFTKLTGEEATYDVLIDRDHAQCECRGYLRWDKCKHIGTIRKLIELGTL